MHVPVARKLGWVQFHHIENVPLFIISDLLLPHQLYWFHPIGQGAGQPGSSENGGGRSAGVRAGERLQRERRVGEEKVEERRVVVKHIHVARHWVCASFSSALQPDIFTQPWSMRDTIPDQQKTRIHAVPHCGFLPSQ